MKYKLLALDLDGTLLDKNNKITSNTIEKLRDLQASGLKIVIATGRMLCSALPYVNKLDIKGPVITYNGAYVKDIALDKVLLHQPIAIDLAREIIQDCQQRNLHLNLYQDDSLYVDEGNQFSSDYEESSGVIAKEVGSLEKFMSKDPTKLLAIEDDRKLQQQYLEEFQEKYKGKLEISESKRNYIEFMAKGVSKAKALKYLADNYQIQQKEVIAIGDSWNDLPMLKWAGMGIAVKTAASEIKAEVDRIAYPPQEDGIAKILETLQL